ncbi:MAG: N-acetylglucosamine-specific PTS transporter subunit IIBC [Woeseia sp.]
MTKGIFENLQKLGRALMLPIAVLPVAGLLLRFGQPDLLDVPMVAAAGAAIFSNLGLLFAIGIGVGLARENNGAAGVAAVVGYFVTTEGAATLLVVPPGALESLLSQSLDGLSDPAVDIAVTAFKERQLAKLSVPAGILSGLLAGWLYNRYSNIRLPDYLAFFGGRRFVPIASGVCGLVAAAAFGLGWPVLESGMNHLSRAVLDAGEVGLFLYGVLNRVLIVTGLHHILNNIAWFLLGDFDGVTGDLRRFFEGDPTAGVFMSGFFPVMMFGLPAACLAMYRSAAPKHRRAIGGLLVSMALTSFLTGVTEPIEYTFMFLAPVLYAIHALLTGASMVLMDLVGVRLGFGFSAGLFDYLLNFNIATRPLWLLPIGAAYFIVYYAMFRYFIVRFNLPTPGRESTTAEAGAVSQSADRNVALLVDALGGAANLRAVDACTTRLRLVVADQALVQPGVLKQLGAHGVIQPTENAVQVVLGPVADQVATEMRTYIVSGKSAEKRDAVPDAGEKRIPPGRLRELTAAFGGAQNVLAIEALAGRLRCSVADRSMVDDKALQSLDVRALTWVTPTVAHVLVGWLPSEHF